MRDCTVLNLRFLGSPREKKMSNRAVEQQNFDAKDPFAGLALVTKPVPKAEPGHVVVRITLRPVNPTDLLSIRSNTLRIPGSEGFGIVHEVSKHHVSLGFMQFFWEVSLLVLNLSVCVSSLLWNVAGRRGSDNSGERAKSSAIFRS